jgi:ribosomal protein S27AE
MNEPGIQAIHELAVMGYRPIVEDQDIRLFYEGAGKPDPDKVTSLVNVVRAHKAVVRHFLQVFCPRCGGVVFFPDHSGIDRCLACDGSKRERT